MYNYVNLMYSILVACVCVCVFCVVQRSVCAWIVRRFSRFETEPPNRPQPLCPLVLFLQIIVSDLYRR